MKKIFSKIIHSERVNLFISLFMSAEMGLSSIAVAYYLLLSLFPLILIVANVLPYLHINVSEVLLFLKNNLPTELYTMSVRLVRQVLSQPNAGLLVISIALALWTFSKAMSALQMAMNKAYGVNKHRDIIISRMFGILGGLVVMILLYFAVVISTFGQNILTQLYHHFNFNLQIYHFFENTTLPFIMLIAFIVLIILYMIMPNVKINKFRYILPGTIFSMIVLVLFPNLVGRYVSNALRTMRDFRLAGSLVIFALMIWFIFISRVLIIGAMLNAVYQRHREGTIETRRGELVEIIKDLRKDTTKD